MTGEVDIPRGPLGATVKRVQQLAARPLVAFVSLFGDRDDVPRRDDGGIAPIGIDPETGRYLYAPPGPTYTVRWPPE